MNRCPNCHSSKVQDWGTEMICSECGNREDLIDYPIATSMYDFEETPEPEKQIIHIHTHLNLDRKAMEHQKRIVSLEENLNRLLIKKGTPLPSPPKYIYSNIIKEDAKPDVSQHSTPDLHSATSAQHSATSQQDNIKNTRNARNARNTPQQGE